MSSEIDLSRRKALKTGGGLGLLAALGVIGLLPTGAAWAQWNKVAFSAKNVDEAFNALGSAAPKTAADLIKLTVPELAENGAVVPVTVSAMMPNVEQISILVDKNPNVLAAHFVLPAGTEGMVTTRVKMGKTSNVIALVKADGQFYRVAREVKVTAGGCGG